MSEVESAKYWLSWLEFGGTIALLLVALGVGYEFIADRLAAPLRKRIEIARETEMGELQKEIADANARAAEANLALAKIRTPRTLTPEQRERIVRAMSAYSGQGFAIGAAPDPEARELASAIGMALISAKWQAGSPTSAIQAGLIGLATGRGVEIEWHSSSSQRTRDVGAALAKVLEEQGLVTTSRANPKSRLFLEAIGITVGTKPQ